MQQQELPEDVQEKIKTELAKLDNDLISIDGVNLAPSQCYHVGLNPLHVLFNTNCPDTLKEKVNGIISGYFQQNKEGLPGD